MKMYLAPILSDIIVVSLTVKLNVSSISLILSVPY